MTYAGYVAGLVLAIYCLGDRGDVGSAFVGMFTIPLGMILGALLGWFGVRRFERGFASRTN
jgi:hypothetical protein